MEIISALCSLESIERKERILDVRIVEAGTLTRCCFSADEPDSGASSESVELKIVVFLEDEVPHEIHRFEAGREIWFETDFLSLSLAEAKELIASASGARVI
jgi:hypothetical protein